ncbi:diguanylate cyclase [Kangiella marina]|uniref:diguanylate cyclase n=1 Tax=Kangiella marina TaxID=1079178 RepID=A0ABP8I9X8_9GAMM
MNLDPDKNKPMKPNRLIKYLFFLLCAIYVVSASYVVEKSLSAISAEQIQEERIDFANEVSLVRSNIESAIYSEIYIANGLATVLMVDKDLALFKFEQLAEALISNGKYVRNIGISTGYTISDVYPLEGNEKALGFDYRNAPSQLQSVEAAREAGTMTLAGPLTLVQGGKAVIARYPIFDDFPDNTVYWGGVSVVINVDQLFDGSGLSQISEEHAIALKGVNGTGAEGDIFYGDESTFDNPDAYFSIDVPNGSWVIAGKLKLNRETAGFAFSTILRVLGYAVALLLIVSATLLYRAYQVATSASYKDTLTGLPNRRYATEVMSKLLAQKGSNAKFSVIIIDLDNFKYINDTFGHDAGDYVLKRIAEILTSTLRESDYVFRLGGDEFLIVIPSVNIKEHLDIIVEKIKSAVSEKDYQYKGELIQASFSAGCGRYPDDATGLTDLLSIADEAMYEDKKSQKDKTQQS